MTGNRTEGPSTHDLVTVILVPSGANGFGFPILSRRQIICGPTFETVVENGLYQSIRTPVGYFDLGTLLSVLPPEQAPEAIIVWADSSNTILPMNLQAFSCPKALMVGDSHHQNSPIQTLLIYAANNGFDRIIVAFRQHTHFFMEAGFSNVHWLQGPMTTPIVRPFEIQRIGQIALLGSLGDLHPQRARILAAMEKKNRYPLITGNFKYDTALELYGTSQISLNVSLNGDMNYRPFEVMGAGGFLLTDKLTPFSGLDILFEEGQHYVDYASIDELLYKLDYYLSNPDECLEIAHRGHEKYLSSYSRDSITRRLWDIVLDNKSEPLFQIDDDERPMVSYQNGAFILPRVAIYEAIQEWQRIKSIVTILFLEGADLLSLFDCADLPRCRIALISEDGAANPLLQPLAGRTQIEYLTSVAAKTRDWHVVVGGHPGSAKTIATEFHTDAIMITDRPFQSEKTVLTEDCPSGYTPSPDGYAIFQRNPTLPLSLLRQRFGPIADVINTTSVVLGIRERHVLNIGAPLPDDLVLTAAGASSWLTVDRIDDQKFSHEFDLVFANEMEHDPAGFPHLLNRIYDLLRPAGRAYIRIKSDPVPAVTDAYQDYYGAQLSDSPFTNKAVVSPQKGKPPSPLTIILKK